MKWEDLSSSAANLLEFVDIIKEDVEYRVGEEINFRYKVSVDSQTVKYILDFQKYITNSCGQQCYSASYDDGLLKIKYLADGLV